MPLPTRPETANRPYCGLPDPAALPPAAGAPAPQAGSAGSNCAPSGISDCRWNNHKATPGSHEFGENFRGFSKPPRGESNHVPTPPGVHSTAPAASKPATGHSSGRSEAPMPEAFPLFATHRKISWVLPLSLPQKAGHSHLIQSRNRSSRTFDYTAFPGSFSTFP